MSKLVTAYEEGNYKVVVARDHVLGIIIQVVKKEMAKYQKEGKVLEQEKISIVKQDTIFFETKKKLTKDYDTLDKEVSGSIQKAIQLVKSMATKEALGNNILNNLEKKYDGPKK